MLLGQKAFVTSGIREDGRLCSLLGDPDGASLHNNVAITVAATPEFRSDS